MPQNHSPAALVCHDMICVLDKNITLENGTVLEKGSTVIMLPKTTGSCVLMENEGISLEALLPKLSRVEHVHVGDQTNLADYSNQLLIYSNRLQVAENNNVNLKARIEALENK